MNGMDIGLIVVIAAVLIFYMRLIALQWGRAKQVRAEEAQASLAKSKTSKKKQSKPEENVFTASMRRYGFRITSWWLLAAGVVFLMIGIIMSLNGLFDPAIQKWWWIPTTLGIGFFFFSFK